MGITFQGFPKMPRLSRDIIITEKIDGTNAQIYIEKGCVPIPTINLNGEYVDVPFLVGSRSRWIWPHDDNYGFARWAYEHADELLQLGPGTHYGEWYGQGIQRTYGLKEKRFALFNTARWSDPCARPDCCGVVPVLYTGPFDLSSVLVALETLAYTGSVIAPGFMRPEGIVVFHTASGHLYKKTIENDDKRKGEVK